MNLYFLLKGKSKHLCLLFILLTFISAGQAQDCVSTISGGFNGTDVAAGKTLWFNAHFTQIKNVPNCSTTPSNISVIDPVIKIKDKNNNLLYTVYLPEGNIIFSPTATTASTTYTGFNQRWTTTIPCSYVNGSNVNNDVFMTGIGFTLPSNLQGGANIDWTAIFGGPSPSAPGKEVSVSWQWGAAVYVNFPSNMNDLWVTPIHDGSPHAGAPTNPQYTANNNVIGGGTGGGSANVTGSWSSTGNSGTCPGENIILPVTFKSFTATRNGTSVALQWVTASERNNNGFTVQRNSNSEWKNIAFVSSQASGGNSSSDLSYTFSDDNQIKGVSQYRLQQIDKDGKATYSTIRAVRYNLQQGKLVVYPNPAFGGKINVVLDDASTTAKDIFVSDIQGRLIKKYQNITSNVLLIEKLARGFYTIKVTDRSTGISEIEKVVVN